MDCDRMDCDRNEKKRKRSPSPSDMDCDRNEKKRKRSPMDCDRNEKKRKRSPSPSDMDCDRNEKKRKRSPSPSAAENTSSASASALVGEYEVFLSFYGKDTRQTFTDFLYTSLVGARIRTFKDNNELRVGEKISSELPKAIKESQISIPILSPNYSSSKWCLIELAKMVECHETMGQVIFPIFFDVDPSDVRHQRGSYQAVDQHKVDEKIVQGWKNALRKVGELKGLELKKESNGLQGELARRVTSQVLSKLKKNYLIDVPEEFFGMDHHVDEMMTRLNVDSSDVRIVGIAGMGGIGKSTIARYIFNQLSERFNEGCSFIADIRERSNRPDLVKLQKELCSNILKDKDEIYNVDEGLKKIRRGVGTKKVLIVLDDVDTIDQFNKLVGKREWFASGSRIMVTTRDKHVLNRIPVDSIYEPPPMESNNSLQLFSKHAFRRDSPPKEYDSLSRDFVNVAAGLPLALEVIGSYLCDKEKSHWPAILHMFKEIPPEDVQKKLKISYDALPNWQQQIFLDIACFFIGEDKCIASYLWDVRKARPAVVPIEELVLKCLIKIGDDNIIWMHDQLRDLGRSIVLNENSEEPWQRSRVWSHEDASKTMETCKRGDRAACVVEMDYQGQGNAKRQKRSPSPSTIGNASSSSASGGKFEVFLSFCGKDTRKTFTDFLYNDLIDAGIRTYRDNEELHVGEEIGPELLKAIKESKISIPVFSKNYASSKWCLCELAQMVECRTTLGQKILPIFYDVEPSDVRHQTGSFEQAFLNHQERFDGTIVQGWKEALTKVGELKGWELKNETDGHEGELAKMVTTKVLIELKKNYMDVTEDLVGTEDQVKEMEKLLNAYSDAVQIVGILGMGGIGKTTLAKVIYNQIFKRFEGCCFLSDVRRASKVVDLQNELCRKILKVKHLPDIANVDEGCHRIKDTVCRKKVLIVLDDVDKKSQFDKLVKREWFDKKSAQGSKIIVTTRNKQVLTSIAVDSTYEPPLMEFNHSLHLFSKHAFRKDFPPEEYDTLSRKFVDTAAGLPLALEVIGSNLYAEKNKSDWQGILEKLENIPDNEVEEKLKISYGALDYEQKQIFLDIACFFIGKEKRVATYMWDACKFYPAEGIKALVLRSLIKITDDNKLWMHDQLRDMGRDIVCKENCAKPWERSRVWSCEDASETMERCKETQEHEAVKVEAFKVEVDSVESDPTFPKEFGQLKRLRYLEVEYEEYPEYILDEQVSAGDAYVADFKHHFPKLRWLKWHGFKHYRVTNFHLEKLIILDLSWSSFRDNSDWWNQIKMAKNLKVLNLTGCQGFDQATDFSTFAALEMLILQECCDLVKIDPSIGNLTSLRVLDISHCKSITELPDAIGNLEKLEEINASRCEKLEGEFPDIRRLSSLRILNLSCTGIYKLPKSICELTRLETLDLREGELQSLPELPSSLTSLGVTCTSMKAFPSLSKLKCLKQLYFLGFFDLVEIPTDIGKLSKLEILRLIDNSISTLPAEIGDLPWLQTLSIRSHKIQSIQGLPSSLIDLSISSSRSMDRLPDLSNLKNLSTLFVRRCSKLMHIKCLGKIESLTTLTVIKCKKLAEVNGLENYESLRYLTTKGCKSLYRLSDLSNLGMLKDLDVSHCRKLAIVEGLSFLKSLEVLNMSFYTSLDILDLSNLGMLKNLDLPHCRKLAKVEGLSFLKSLEVLNMSFCTSLDILDLSNLGMLKNLDLPHCRKLAKVEGLSFLKSLEVLNMTFCTSLEGILDLSNLGMLKNLDLSCCRKLAKVVGLSFLKSLEVLNMSFCTSLEGILDLSNLKKLTCLKLSGWNNLNMICGFEELESLVALDISYCEIEKSPDFSNLKKLRRLDISGSSKLIENPLDFPDIIIIYNDSYCASRSEPSENEEEDTSDGGSDETGGYSDSGLDSDLEYEGYD